MIVVLLGKNEAAIRRRLRAMRAEVDGGTGMLESNLAVFDASATPADVIAAAATVPFLAPRRLVVVEGLLDRFDVGRGEARPGRALEAWSELLDWLEAACPPTTTVVFVGSGEGRRNPMLERLRALPGAVVEEYAEPKGESLLRFVREAAAERGIRFATALHDRALPAEGGRGGAREGDPALLLALLTQGDTLTILSELDKLALFAMGREVTGKDVARLCGGERATSVWEFVDAVMDGDLAAAGRALRALERAGESDQGILALLANGYRTLVTVLDLLEAGVDEESIGKAINRPYPRLRQAAIRRARSLGREGVLAAYEAIVATDRAIKAGDADPDVALDLLVIRLCALRSPRAAGAAARA